MSSLTTFLASSAVLASFALAAYEDIREREVHDLIWAPGIVGLALLLLLNPLPYRLPLALFLGAAGYLAARLGYVGQADAIALLLWSSLGGALEFILASLGALAGLLGHLALLKLRGRRRAELGLPMVAYLALGYLLAYVGAALGPLASMPLSLLALEAARLEPLSQAFPGLPFR